MSYSGLNQILMSGLSTTVNAKTIFDSLQLIYQNLHLRGALASICGGGGTRTVFLLFGAVYVLIQAAVAFVYPNDLTYFTY